MTSTDAKNFLASLDSIPMTAKDAPPELINKLNEAMKALREDKVVWFSTANLPHEIWREVEGYNGGYLISIFGRVKSKKKSKPLILKYGLDNVGYPKNDICKSGSTKTHRIHRLVAKAFLNKIEGKPEINHIDGCKLNNCVWNLEWVTREENEKHAYSIGLKTRGEGNGMAKLTTEDVAYIRENPDHFNLQILAKKFAVTVTTISAVQTGKTYKDTKGNIRKAQEKKLSPPVPDDIRKKIKSEFVPYSKEFGTRALGRKYGYDHTTISRIIKGGDD